METTTMSDRYIAMICSIVGDLDSGSTEDCWAWDGQAFAQRADAISHGFTYGRSDDFNIGILDSEPGALRAIEWMDETREQDPGELRDANRQLGLVATVGRA